MKLPPTTHAGPVTIVKGWRICAACMRAWKPGKPKPRCAPFPRGTRYYGR